MTTYLTKVEDDKMYHFKVTAHNNLVQITHGIFYSWLSQYTEGCGDNRKILLRFTTKQSGILVVISPMILTIFRVMFTQDYF